MIFINFLGIDTSSYEQVLFHVSALRLISPPGVHVYGQRARAPLLLETVCLIAACVIVWVRRSSAWRIVDAGRRQHQSTRPQPGVGGGVDPQGC